MCEQTTSRVWDGNMRCREEAAGTNKPGESACSLPSELPQRVGIGCSSGLVRKAWNGTMETRETGEQKGEHGWGVDSEKRKNEAIGCSTAMARSGRPHRRCAWPVPLFPAGGALATGSERAVRGH